MAAAPFLAACSANIPAEDSGSLMIDCVFETNRHVHMHVSEKRGAVTLVSRYTPGSTKSHSEDLRRGLESEGRIISSRDHRLKSELFLLNDHFGEKPGEVVFVEVRDDGISRMEAKAVSGAIRQIDSGTCSLRHAAQR
ncbi:hypothetical protein KBY71_02085 [Cyanobium sp. T1B-Tous]|uniref:hypothetical protein n=1 Tax=Cyanobium sp. T1B-Tous TaxID=2823721 RepID=UPI0020CEA9D1|nr:hypothetical protein [Cyanobium sp. T1B-Tous]MCP9805309.1 hypothetical protein [Cyanobium sp. T1B-Tous]